MATADHIQVPEDSTDARKETVVGATPQAAFDFPWPYFNAADIKVYVDGVATTTGFTLTPTATKEGGFQGGVVTFAVALTNKTVILERELAYARTEDFEYPSNKLAIQALNTALDRVLAMFQQVRRVLKRTLRQPLGDVDQIGELPPQAARAGKLFGFDQHGNPTATTLGQTITTPLPIAEGGTGATTAAAARTALDVDVAGTASGLMTAHAAASDPHPQYLTAAEGNAAYQPLDPDLTAIAGLTSAADRLPYFTGAGAAALATFTAAGRALVAGADNAAQRATLGLDTAATMAGPTGTIVGTSDAQTLTNKTITGATLSGLTTLPGSSRISSTGAIGLGTAGDPTGGALQIAQAAGTASDGMRLTRASGDMRVFTDGTDAVIDSYGGGISFRDSGTQRMRMGAGGAVCFPFVSTTASGANAFLDSGSSPANNLLRSTSSRRYKRDIEDAAPALTARVYDLRPIWYRSKAEADPSAWSWWGLIAEEVAAVDPRLVQWGYAAEDYEDVELEPAVVERVQTGLVDAAGVAIVRSVVTTPARVERRVKAGAVKVPDGVAYDRLAVLLLAELKALRARVAALEAGQ